MECTELVGGLIFFFQQKTCGSSRFSAPALARARARARVCVCVESNHDSIQLVFFESFHVLLKQRRIIWLITV
jgi:hypothetical protein